MASFELDFLAESKVQLEKLSANRGLLKRFKAVIKRSGRFNEILDTLVCERTNTTPSGVPVAKMSSSLTPRIRLLEPIESSGTMDPVSTRSPSSRLLRILSRVDNA